jgi:phospholipid/cholesterol/gamma-HCH transport system substrate-binding protein
MPRRAPRDLTIGVVAALALAVLAFAILAVGGESRLFADRAAYQVIFPSTEGLAVGSPVMVAGVQVGTVTGIRLPTDPGATGIHVRVGVDRRFAGRVRTDSQAALRILQFLSQEKYIEITPGAPGSEPLPENSVIPLVAEPGVFEQGEDIAQNLNDITFSLKEILGPLQRGEGLLGELIHDPEFGREGLDRLRAAAENVEALTGQLREGKGFMGRLLYDREFAETVDDLAQGIENFNQTMSVLAEQKDTLRQLLGEGGDLTRAVADLREGAASLKRITTQLESRDGLVGRLLYDPAYSERLSLDLQTTLADLAQIVRKINEGEGTLGALVNDRALHDGMEQVVAGANDSKLTRWLLRRYQKKGIKAQER